MKARKFDADFDSGKDVTAALDLSRARRPAQKKRRKRRSEQVADK